MSKQVELVPMAHEGRSCTVRLELDHNGNLTVEAVNPEGEIRRQGVAVYNTIQQRVLTDRKDLLKAFREEMP